MRPTPSISDRRTCAASIHARPETSASSVPRLTPHTAPGLLERARALWIHQAFVVGLPSSVAGPARRLAGCSLAALCACALWAAGLVTADARTFCVDYSKHPDMAALLAHDLSIVSPEAELDLDTLHRGGHRSLAYLSVVEVALNASYRNAVLARQIPVVATNETWNSLIMDISNPAWRSFLIDQLAAEAMRRPFDGFFLDTVDSVEVLCARFPNRAEQFRADLADIVRALSRAYPGRSIILNRGFDTAKRVGAAVQGVLIESMFQTTDPRTRRSAAVPAADTTQLIAKARECRAAGQDVYVLDYVDPADPALARATATRIAAQGFFPFISTPALDGEFLGPVREVPRRVLCLYGNQERDVHLRVRWPVDSVTANTLQAPLEWLGYEVDYVNPAEAALPTIPASRYAGIVLDRALRIPAAREMEVARWLVRQHQAGHRILFVGVVPFSTEQALEIVLETFKFKGSREIVRPVNTVRILERHTALGFEAPITPQTNNFVHLEAPAGSTPWLSLEATTTSNQVVRFDPVFVAPWGGAILDPYVFFQRPDHVDHWLIDPFQFLPQVFRTPAWPAPDTTTRDGCRVLYSHIDGDGFRHFSSVQAGKRSGEIVIDRILKRYPFHFTVSVIEAEIRGLVKLQHRDDEPQLTELAREMFKLPNVEPASHSFSHPFYWMENDRDSVLYEAQRLELKPDAGYTVLDLEREILGSIRYIQDNLLPPGKKVELFLWTGNCRPPPNAIRLVRELGIENMNGGETTISRKHPTLTRVAPRAMPWNDELQIFAANQNENVYQERWQSSSATRGPFLAGFIHALDTFQLTETPRRLKPINIYFHFYSADTLAAFRALDSLFAFAATNEVRSITASEYARTARDARQTRLFTTPEQHWILATQGHLRTFRLAPNSAQPDLTHSRNLTGFRHTPGGLYVHTDGSPRVTLQLSQQPQPAPHARLLASTAPITFSQLEPQALRFTTSGPRPANVTLAGLPPSTPATVLINDTPTQIPSDQQGQLRLELATPATVSVRVTPTTPAPR